MQGSIFKKRRSFSKSIVAYMLLLTIIPFSIIGFYYNYSIYKNLESAAYQNADVQIKHTKDAVNTNIDIVKLLMYKIMRNRQIISAFANSSEQSYINLSRAEETLQEDVFSSYGWVNGLIKSVYIFQNADRYIRVTRAPEHNSEIVRNRELFLKHFDTYGALISGDALPDKVFHISVALMDESLKVGYIVIAIDASILSKSLEEIQTEDFSVYITDESNLIFAGSAQEDIGKTLSLRPQSERTALDSESKLFIHSEVLTDNIRQKTGVSLMIYVLVLLFGVFISVAISIILSRNLTKDFRKLILVINEFAKGNRDVRAPQYKDEEIDAIGKAFNHMGDNVNKLLDEVYQKEILVRDAQLHALQAQMNPHFLFNTLTTIATIAKCEKNDLVSNMVRNLSKLLRERIITKHDDFAALDFELQLVDYYIYIQKVRYKGRINYILNKHPLVPVGCTIPKLMLQPLVENAFCHGIEKKLDGGTITVNIGYEDGYLVIEICDDGVGFVPSEKMSAGEHAHITLVNIRKRLELYYENDFVFDIQSEVGKGTKVIIKLPVKKTE